ncbi:MAG: RluA family pseudouridine synthase [Puniceicoccales bacterium]|jgi:23S rRNA-/tRNA-specific pseudouridylate synthase|nr:RluA family pseudouridine synthase [Puniceicoccales bacterium]
MMEQPWQMFLNQRVSVNGQSDDGIVALEKPVGILSHPNGELRASKAALFTCKYSLKFEKYVFDRENFAVYLLNRLDAPVSGLILVALNEEIAHAVKFALKERTIEKKYLALLKGHLPDKSGCWRSNIAKTKCKNCVRAEGSGNVAAVTKYRLMREFLWKNFTLSFVELQLLTGRTHQLRLHCSKNHVPIVGDRTYGDFNFNRQFYKLAGNDRLFLHSNEVDIHYQCGGKTRNFHAKSKCCFADHCLGALAQ